VSFSLKKHEILRSKKNIKELFDNGSSFFLYPFKVYFLPDQSAESSTKVLFTVSKKYFKKAVQRNVIRRRMREAYRLNKNNLKAYQKDSLSISLALIYISRSELPFTDINNKLKQVFIRLNKIEDKIK
jgi:ribonuclease P protein component